ncbi:MAG TPA: hypothetical protein VEB64_18110 [Azospirillaceae bacterium]|nr:hypothetical protein [Azospirillaceae bacterium]
MALLDVSAAQIVQARWIMNIKPAPTHAHLIDSSMEPWVMSDSERDTLVARMAAQGVSVSRKENAGVSMAQAVACMVKAAEDDLTATALISDKF